MRETAVAAALVAWLNVYLIRQAFFTEFSGYANAMHGFWVALSQVPFVDWLRPTWFALWDGGMPLEFTYAPLVPWLIRLLSFCGLTPFHAWHVLAGAVFVLVPVALVIAARREGVSAPVACGAGVVYSLFAFSELIAPETRWGQILRPQRMQLVFVWDDAPHMLAIGLFLLGWRPLAMLANAFGLVLTALEALLRWRWAPAVLGGLMVWPWWPPSLMLAIRRNAEGGFSWIALVAALGPALWIARRSYWGALTWTFASILLFERYAGLHFAPQPMRYVLEFSVALTLLLATLVERCPVRWRMGLAVLVALVCVGQVIEHRRFAKTVLREVPVESTFEYQLARRLAAEKVAEPVFLPGSAAAWLNAFAPIRQMGGGSFSTAYDPALGHALDVVQGRVPGEDPVAALRQFGVRTVVVSLKGGREFWKPFADPSLYEGKLPVVWTDSDVVVYSVPGAEGKKTEWRPGIEAWGTRLVALVALGWFLYGHLRKRAGYTES